MHHRFLTAALLVAVAALPGTLQAQSARQNSSADGGMVAAAQPLATEAGIRMLEMGGNAADAAVAAGFAIAVVEPTMNSIGGRNQILIRLPDGSVAGIDGTTQAPWDYDYDTAPQASYGYPVIGVPGAVAGLMRLHGEYGSLPLATVMAPAIDLAENGFRLLPGEAARHGGGMEQGREFPGTRASYLEADGSAYDPGDMLVQKDYARTLRAIAAGGHDAFYRGEIAERMAADLAANGSAVKLEAFHDYEALDADVVRGSYRGYDIVGLGVPAAGAVVVQALQALENFDPDDYTDAEWAAMTGQALGMASRELRAINSDSAAVRAVSKEYARYVADQIRAPAVAGGDGRGLPAPLGDRLDDQGHTTHLTTADAAGMMVALTQTLGPNMGSKVVTPGLGFLYASTLGGYLGRMEPGDRARSFISPVMVFRDGRPVLALGAAGGARIVSGVTQVISRVIDDGMDLAHALEAPRVHMNGEVLDAETTPGIGWSPTDVAQMRALWPEVSESAWPGSFSRVHAVHFDGTTWYGGADPDWEGSARGPSKP
ncbi:MAG: gamma-glutamyltransferase [Longimicrobiales bacterium]